MGQEQYFYHTLTPDPEGKINLGKYEDPIIILRSKLFREKIEDQIEEIETTTDNYWAGIIVATNTNDETVAYGALKPPNDSEPDAYELAEAYVRTNDRRKGIYKQLLRERIKLAREHDAKSVLLVALTPKIKQRSYLKKEGFKKYVEEDRIIYRKKL